MLIPAKAPDLHFLSRLVPCATTLASSLASPELMCVRVCVCVCVCLCVSFFNPALTRQEAVGFC